MLKNMLFFSFLCETLPVLVVCFMSCFSSSILSTGLSQCLIQMGNKGAFLRFKAPDMKPDVVTFSAVVSVLQSLSLYLWLKFLQTLYLLFAFLSRLFAFLRLTKWPSNLFY